jgi:hypothetical protein
LLVAAVLSVAISIIVLLIAVRCGVAMMHIQPITVAVIIGFIMA